MFIFVLIRIKRKHFWVSYVVYKGISQKWGLVHRGQCRVLSKLSNDILTGLTDQGNTYVTIFYKLVVCLKKIIHKKTSLNLMFGWCLTFDAVYVL